MRTAPDLHPDDPATRCNLQEILVDTRLNYGMSQADLGHAMGILPTTVWHMERHRTNWRLSIVQRWAHALRLRLVIWPECLPPDESLFLLRPGDPAAGWAYDRRVWIDALSDARRWVGLTQRRVGDRLAISENAIWSIERERDILMLTGQRYCRALDSSLYVGLEEVTP